MCFLNDCSMKMSLSNFSSPYTASFGSHFATWSATSSPLHPIHQQLTLTSNNLPYLPDGLQQNSQSEVNDHYRNEPYSPPSTFRRKVHQPRQLQAAILSGFDSDLSHHESLHLQRQKYMFHKDDKVLDDHRKINTNTYLPPSLQNPLKFHSSERRQLDERLLLPPQNIKEFHNHEKDSNSVHPPKSVFMRTSEGATDDDMDKASSSVITNLPNRLNTTTGDNEGVKTVLFSSKSNMAQEYMAPDYPAQPVGFTRVQAGQGRRTQVHAILDYDQLKDEDEEDGSRKGDYNGDRHSGRTSRGT